MRNRWSGHTAKGTKGYKWRYETCPYCGASYQHDLSLKSHLGVADAFQHVKHIMSAEARVREENGDYSSPVCRRTVLGRMHQLKRELWEQHLSACASYYFQLAESYDLASWEVERALEAGCLSTLLKHVVPF